ncbi:hypothetical protein BG011_005176 [Mortierella polycephala]|uniref:Uncharacterized protein n=1 Tax=Mortierella polycephala TaxID=41804 RepID=A0A9P6U1B1_9FUNG|nr:hypothetical protein BG011_005176 [Mortierella polycephala]
MGTICSILCIIIIFLTNAFIFRLNSTGHTKVSLQIRPFKTHFKMQFSKCFGPLSFAVVAILAMSLDRTVVASPIPSDITGVDTMIRNAGEVLGGALAKTGPSDLVAVSINGGKDGSK